jgi:hypothetical protein
MAPPLDPPLPPAALMCAATRGCMVVMQKARRAIARMNTLEYLIIGKKESTLFLFYAICS